MIIHLQRVRTHENSRIFLEIKKFIEEHDGSYFDRMIILDQDTFILRANRKENSIEA